MSGGTSIEWTDTTWNPVRGCSRVSEGCRNCYAEKMAARFSKPGQPFHEFAKVVAPRDRLDRTGGRRDGWTGKVALVPEKLAEPLGWKKPQRVFVNSMSDLFHEALPDEAIDRVFAVMALAPQHTFQVLTKRAERMRDYMTKAPPLCTRAEEVAGAAERIGKIYWDSRGSKRENYFMCAGKVGDISNRRVWPGWPLPNVWLGVSVEDQTSADERIPHLLATPAQVRFISAEPLLGPVDLSKFMWPVCEGWPAPFRSAAEAREAGAAITRRRQALVMAGRPFVKWVIVGGESGPGARPCDQEWVRSIVRQCQEAGAALFVKQLGARPICGLVPSMELLLQDRKGGDPAEWPEDLRVREFPEPRP
jgi:protein gp37